MKATSLGFTTAPISLFALADVNGVIRLRQVLPVNVPSSGSASAAQATADTAITNAATAQAAAVAAQGTANTGVTNAATAQGTANTAVTDAATAQAAAVAAQATADAATSTHSTLVYGATTNIDFALANYRSLALTGNVTFTTSNRAAPRTVSIKILADGSIRTFTFPAGWIFVGAAAPADIAASKTAILTVTCFGAADTDVVAAYAVEP